MCQKAKSLTVLITLLFAHQISCNQRLFNGRALSTATAEQISAFNKEWDKKEKDLQEQYIKDKREVSADYTNKFKEHFDSIKALEKKAAAGEPIDITPVPSKDDRVKAHEKALVTKRSEEPNQKYRAILTEERKVLAEDLFQIDVSNPDKLSDRSLVYLKRRYDQGKLWAQKSFDLQKRKLDESCQNSNSSSETNSQQAAIDKLTKEYNENKDTLTKSLEAQIKVAGSDEELIKKLTEIMSDLLSKLEIKHKTELQSLQSGTGTTSSSETGTVSQDCLDKLKKLEEQKESKLKKLEETYPKRIALMEKQLAEQKADPSKVPTNEQLKVRNELIKAARNKYSTKQREARLEQMSEVNTIKQAVKSELEAWKASLGNTMSQEEMKNYLPYKSLVDRNNISRSRNDSLNKLRSKYNADLAKLKTERAVALNALNGGSPNSTPV